VYTTWVHDPEKELARMLAFLFIFGLTATFVVGGVMSSLRLSPHRVATRRRLSGLRRSYAAPMGYTTAVNSRRAEDVSTRYTCKALVTSILLLLSVILIGAIDAVMH
jgi:hypothetical protein